MELLMQKVLLKAGKNIYPNKLKILKPLKVAIIGSGKMADEYSKVVESFGHKIKILISKSNSKNSIFLSKKYKSLLSSKISDISHENIDLIIICSKWNELYEDVCSCLKIKKPILVEKSIILNRSRIKKIYKHRSRIFFAYNRNYYDFINFLQSYLKNNNPELIRLSIYDSYKNIIKNKGKKIQNYLPIYITSHWITFVYFLLKKLGYNLNFKKKFQLKNNFFSLNFFKVSHKTKIKKKINLEILNYPDKFENHSVEFYGKNLNLKLNSFEKLEIIKKLTKKKIKSQFIYAKDIKLFEVDYTFKPGLRYMYYNFVNDYVLKIKANNHISLTDLEKIYKICNDLKLKI